MMLTNVRLSFPHLWTAHSYKPDQKKKFSATFIIPKDRKELITEVRKAMLEAAKAKWGEKAEAQLKALKAQNRLCLRDGAEKADMDGFGEDVLFVGASNDKRPNVFDRDRAALAEEDGRPYAGCWVNASIELWAQDNEHGKRVNASLLGVQFVKDDEPFGGGAAPATAEDFPALEDEAETADAADDWDDDEPF